MSNIKVGETGRIKGIRKLTEGLAAQDIYSAIEPFELLGGQVDSYEQSTFYDLVVNSKRYPPESNLWTRCFATTWL